MHFTSFLFLFFLAVVLLAFFQIQNSTLRKFILLISSLIFYGIWDVRFLFLLSLTALLDYFCSGKIFEGKQPRRYLVLSLTANLAVLFFFKYFNFFYDSAVHLAALLNIYLAPSSLRIILPVGLSFYTFQAMSYTIDCYRRHITVRPPLLDYCVFASFFPQLVAGPIVRAYDFLPQLRQLPVFDRQRFHEGVTRLAVGFFKKLVVSSYFAAQADRLFPASETLSSFQVLLAGMSFGMQIYFDFSAYSDIALGTAHILGFKIPENFHFPYTAQNPSDFWRRWHISLSSWLRDYLYIPLGGNRQGSLKQTRNSFLTMLLGGLWHGANWTFVIWGAFHGLLLSVNQLREWLLPKSEKPRLWASVLFFLVVSLSWIPFRAFDFLELSLMIQNLLSVHRPPLTSDIFLFVGILFLGPVIQFYGDRWHIEKWLQKSFWSQTLTILFCLLAIYFFRGETREFIYFQF